ncbi:hypothetical protein SteCoe_456 [Stentor coeruleus]|uniref:EGF-like domain-containing protein n=1 Tax=Stentor coeruleus TaxID=5963 RepID=A0A1R2D483_9CILI|nr:hypothetical protein SteCoe_456 [Stentor coeruleus]
MNALLFLIFSVQSKFIEISSFTQAKVGSYNFTTVLKDDTSNLELANGVLVYAYTDPPILLEGGWKKLTKAGVANFTTKINCMGTFNISIQSYGYTPPVSKAVTIDSSLSSSCRNFKISSIPQSPQTNQTTEIALVLFNTSGSPTIACNYSVSEFTGVKLFNYVNLTTNNTLGDFSMIFISPGIKTLYADCLGNFSKKIDINVMGSKVFYLNITVFNLQYEEMMTTFSALVEVFGDYGIKETNTVFSVKVFSPTSEIAGETFKNTSNGEAYFDGLSISKLGTFQVSAFSEGLWTAISSPVSVKSYAKISILSDPVIYIQPENTTSLFSIKIEMFSDELLSMKVTNQSYQASLTLNITRGLLGLKKFTITNGEAIINGLQIVKSGTFTLIVNGTEIHDSYSNPITVTKTKYIALDIIKVQSDVYVYGALTLYDENDAIITSNDAMFYLYTEPYNTVETGLWNTYTIQGKFSFYLSVYCPAVFNLVAYSPGFASGISQTVFKNTTKGCNQIIIQPNTRVQDTNKTISFNISLIGPDNKVNSGYSLSIAEINGSKIYGKTTISNFGNYALTDISFFSSGLKRVSFYINGYYSNIIEILIKGPEMFYLNGTILPQNPIRTTDIFNFSVEIFKDYYIKSVDKDFEVIIYTQPDGNLTGVKTKTSTLGTALFDSLSILNYGVYQLIAYSEGLFTYNCQIEIKVYSKISLLSNEPNSMMSEFSVCVEIFSDSDLLNKFYQNEYTVMLSVNKTNSFIGTSTKRLSNGIACFYGLEIISPGYISLIARGLGLFNSTPIVFFISSTSYIFYSSRLAPTQTISGFISANSADNKVVQPSSPMNIHFYAEPPSTLSSNAWSLLLNKTMIGMSGFMRCPGDFTLIAKSNGIASGILFSLSSIENSQCYPLDIISSHYMQETNKTITLDATMKYDNGTLIPGYDFLVEEASNSIIYGIKKYTGTNGTVKFNISFISPGSKKVLVVYNNYYSKMIEIVINGTSVQFLNLTFLDKIPENTTGEFKLKVDILGDRNISYVEKNYDISLGLTPDGSLFGPTTIQSINGSSIFKGIYPTTAGVYQLVAFSQGCYSSFSKNFTIKGYLKVIVHPVPVIIIQLFTSSYFNVEVILYNDVLLTYPYQGNYSDVSLYINNTTPLGYFYKSVQPGKLIFYNAQISNNDTYFISASSNLFLNASSDIFTIKNTCYLAIENINIVIFTQTGNNFTLDIVPYNEQGIVITSWVTDVSLYTNPSTTIYSRTHILNINDGKRSITGSICNFGAFQFIASVANFTSASTNFYTFNETTCGEIIIQSFDDSHFTNTTFTLSISLENIQFMDPDNIRIFEVYQSKVYSHKTLPNTSLSTLTGYFFNVTVISPGIKILKITYCDTYSKTININVTGPAINYLYFNSYDIRELRIVDAGTKVKFNISVMNDYGICDTLNNAWISVILVPDGIMHGTIAKPSINGIVHFDDLSVLSIGQFVFVIWSENIISTVTCFFEVLFHLKITFTTEIPLHSQSTFGVLCEIFYDKFLTEKVYTGEYSIQMSTINEYGRQKFLAEGNTTNAEIEFDNLKINDIGQFKLEASGHYIAYYITDYINLTNCYIKLNIYSVFPMTILSNFSINIEIYEDLEFTRLFIDGSYNISIYLNSTTMNLEGPQYGLTTNGKLIMDNFRISEEGVYNLTSSGFGLENAQIQNIEITKLYAKLTFIPRKPNNTEDNFSLQVMVFYDQNMSMIYRDEGFYLYLSTNSDFYFRGNSFKFLDEGFVIFNNLSISTEGTFRFVIEGDEIYPVQSEEFTIVIMNEVNEIYIETPGPFMKMDILYNVKVLLIGYYNTSYTRPATITLKSSNLQFIGTNTLPNINGSATFSIKFASLGSTNLTAFTDQDYYNVKKSPITIFSIDPLCAYFSSDGKCYECIPNSIINQNLCTCVPNSIYKIDSCICNTGYKNYNNECKKCINRYSSDNITSSYTRDYKGITINFASAVNSIQNTSCENLVILPDELKGKIVSCVWKNSRELVLHSDDLLKPVEVVIKVLENVIPYYNECLVENVDTVTVVKVPGDFPVPSVELSGPKEYSILCSSDNIIIFNKMHNNDYDYNWTINGVKDDMVGVIEEQHGSSLEIGYQDLVPGKVEVEVCVLSKNFGTKTVNNFTVNVVDEVKLIVGFNYGYFFKAKTSENIEITALLLSSCGLNIEPSFTWSYLSQNTLNFTYIKSISPRNNSLSIPSHTLLPNNIYSFQALVLYNQQNISGSGIINIEVTSQDLIITLNKWNGPVGTDKDLEIKALASDPDNPNADIIITWTCTENSTPCLGNNNEILINNYISPILIIGKSTLRNSASYFFTAKASTLTKEKNASVEIMINEKIIGDVSINSNSQKNSNDLSFLLIVNVSYTASFYWELQPYIQGFLLLDINKPYIKVPDSLLIPGITYTLKLTMSSNNYDDITIQSLISRKPLPTCKNITSNEDNIGKIFIKVYECSSQYGNLAYQYGVVDKNNTIYWKTGYVYLPYYSIWGLENIEKVVVRICDDYGCDMVYNEISYTRNLRYLKLSEDIENELKNTISIPDTVMYYTNIIKCEDFQYLITYAIYYFSSEYINNAEFDLYISCINMLFTRKDCMTTENIQELSTNTLMLLKNYNEEITESQGLAIINAFDCYSYDINFMFLDNISKLILNKIVYDWFPGKEAFVYEGNISIYYHRSFSYELYGKNIGVNNMMTVLPSSLDLDYEGIYDIKLLVGPLEDNAYGIVFYKSGTYRNYCLDIKTPVECNNEIHDFEVNISSNGLIYDEKISCFTLKNNSIWEDSGCSVNKIVFGNATVRLEYPSTFKLQESLQECQKSKTLLIIMCLFISLCTILCLAFYFTDKKIISYESIPTLTKINPLTSLFYQQPYQKRAISTLQILINSLLLLFLIILSDMLIKNKLSKNSINHSVIQFESLFPSFIALIFLQIISAPCFILNTLYDKSRFCIYIQYTIWILSLLISIIGISICSFTICSTNTKNWATNFFIIWPFQFVLEIMYSMIIKIFIYKINRTVPVIDLQDIPSSTSQRMRSRVSPIHDPEQDRLKDPSAQSEM